MTKLAQHVTRENSEKFINQEQCFPFSKNVVRSLKSLRNRQNGNLVYVRLARKNETTSIGANKASTIDTAPSMNLWCE
jgi:hypothetical protein